MLNAGGIVLCGGKSSRMGLPKATLPFGNEPMLQRVVRLLREAVQPIVVVAATNQELPSLSSDVLVARDQRADRGPLEGMLAGLLAIRERVEAAYVTSCDVPLLQPDFVRVMLSELGEFDVAVPVVGDFHHPLAAVYRTRIVPEVERLLEQDRLRPFFLFQQVPTRRVVADRLRSSDPELQTLRNLNHPEDYLAALRAAQFEPDPGVLKRLKADPRSSEADPHGKNCQTDANRNDR